MYSITELIKTGNQLFHTADLGIIWQINKKGTLYTRIYRYIKKGILFPIHKGLYSIIPPEKLDPIKIGQAVNHGYCYLTTEKILENHGVINRRVEGYTFVGEKNKKFELFNNRYLFRKLKKDYLYRNIGVIHDNGNFTATLERAVADIQYFNHNFNFDHPNTINWDKVKQIQKEVGYI